MSDLNEVTEAMNARYMANRLGLPQPGLFLTEDEVVCDVKARFDAKDARIAQLEAEVARLRAVVEAARKWTDADEAWGCAESETPPVGWLVLLDEVKHAIYTLDSGEKNE